MMLLVCTVGGSFEPVRKVLLEAKPARVHFVHSQKTRDFALKALEEARRDGLNLGDGAVDWLELADPEDLSRCLQQLRPLAGQVEGWLARAAEASLWVDITGGTKCMSAALALQARLWRCTFSYVGGSERTKGGVGVTVSGSERPVTRANPWDTLGYQAVEEFATLFNRLAFAAAAEVAKRGAANASDPAVKSEMAALRRLAEGFDAWDRFDHAAAAAALGDAAKNANNLRAALGGSVDPLLRELDRIREHLGRLKSGGGPSRERVVDLLANADRCRRAGRRDDAVARLYRAIEATAQRALMEGHGLTSSRVPLDRVPEPLRTKWSARACDGVVKCALEQDFQLLAELGDDLGRQFKELSLGPSLSARNNSVLAHGFVAVGQDAWDALWPGALALAALTEADLPSFPTLAVR